MNPELLEKVLACPRLPSLPAIAVKVLELTQDENVSIKQIADTITNDQGLSSKVLRTVNSSFYGLRKPCSSINQAIVMLGLSAVKTLALGFSLVSSLAKDKSEGFDYTAYWQRSLLTGVAAKRIAAEAGSGQDEECFLGGLLQDVGMIALYQALGKEYVQVLESAGGEHRKLAKAEIEQLEVSHADIGAVLATRWKLPPSLVMPIKFHERATAAPIEHVAVCQAVALGNIAADVMVAAEPAMPLKRFYERAEQWFSLTTAQSDAILKSVAQGSKEMAHLLAVDTGNAPDPEKMLEQATTSLREISLPFDPGGAGADAADPTLRDPATGLPNRTVFTRNVVAGFEQTQTCGGAFSVAVLSVDGFADHLSRHGQEVGNALLHGIATRIGRHFEAAGALACAYEGSQFGVVMPKMDRVAATRCVDAARALVAGGPINVSVPGLVPMNLPATLSAGVATVDAQSKTRFAEPGDLVAVTLKALSAAEKVGANSIRVYAPKAAA